MKPTMINTTRYAFVTCFTLSVLTTALFLTGCGGEKELPVAPVSGKVIFKSETPVNALVVLHAVTKSDAPFAPSGKVASDGTFKITTYKPNDGAPPGEYVATVVWNKEVTGEGGTGAGPNVLPPKYAKPDTSPFKVSVKPGPNELTPFEIKE
jgi:hypothetical protein